MIFHYQMKILLINILISNFKLSILGLNLIRLPNILYFLYNETNRINSNLKHSSHILEDISDAIWTPRANLTMTWIFLVKCFIIQLLDFTHN